ncbi:MAG: hypothetical protein WCO10_00095 [bacterium]
MNEDILWLFKMIGIMLVIWIIIGGPARFEADMAAQTKNTAPKTATVYQPKTYQQTIIAR